MRHLTRFSLFALLLALLSGCAAPVPSNVEGPAPAPTVASTPFSTDTPQPFNTPTPSPSPTLTETPTATPKPAWQQTLETQDLQDKFFQIIDGKPVVDLYDTQTQEKIVLNQESIKITTTTDGLNPNILTALDADSNTYAFNPDHGWFKIPEVQIDYENLSKYAEFDEESFYDGQHNIIRALNYANSQEKIKASNPHVMWVTALGNNLLCLSFFPVGKTGSAQILWPEEYKKTWEDSLSFVFSGFYKVNLKSGGYIYVIDRTIGIDDTHTSGLSNGFDKATYEKLANNMLPSGRTELKMILDGVEKGGYDLVTILPPPEQLADGTSISFDPNTTGLMTDSNPTVASLQGPRGSLILLLNSVDQ